MKQTLLLAGAACLCTATFAQPGTLDTGFGNSGMMTHSFHAQNDLLQAVAVQPDGKIVGAGYKQYEPQGAVVLFRLNSDGSFDNTFGTNGVVTVTYLNNYSGETHGMVLQPDGKIVTCGYMGVNYGTDFSAARFNSDGTLDNSFGSGGLVHYSFGAQKDHFANAIALQPDGKLVLAGQAEVASGYDVGVIRLNSDGTLDNTFDGDGMATYDMAHDDEARAMVLQPDGRIILVGNKDYMSSFILRLNNDGTLDNSFGSAGIGNVDYGTNSEARSVALRPDGTILVGGNTALYNEDFAVARFLSNGSPDATFGTAGHATAGFSAVPYNDRANAMLLQPDGRIVLAGYTSENMDNAMAMMRFNADGSLDTGFNGTGKAIFNLLAGKCG